MPFLNSFLWFPPNLKVLTIQTSFDVKVFWKQDDFGVATFVLELDQLTYLGLCCLSCFMSKTNFLKNVIGMSSRSTCSPAQPLNVDYSVNISPVECLLFLPLTDSPFALRSKDCVLASSSGCYISSCTLLRSVGIVPCITVYTLLSKRWMSVFHVIARVMPNWVYLHDCRV